MDPQMIAQLLAGAGSGAVSSDMAPPEEDTPGDWLTSLINDAHQAMVTEKDPAVVSVLGGILNQLTTIQAKKAQAGGGS